ncbi:sigma-70 family RNA polymerase sigma factor [Chitinimonas sp.]|uniref:sigma-70 family RNA polymerase sigma factor n=1 Tax=Chitinimonas sp. TaxID=1934313 RepID=UPI002F925477
MHSEKERNTGPSDQQLAAQRDYLLRFAISRLSNRQNAEDAVQDALLAALQARAHFRAQSSVRTWLTGILKHKIVDMERRMAREPSLLVASADEFADGDHLDSVFDVQGYWGSDTIRPWNSPDAWLAQDQICQAYEACAAQLPPRQAQAFALCELWGFEIEEVCQRLQVKPGNCWVMLYRARRTLRRRMAAFQE